MQRFTYILALAAIICAGEALAITIEQENAAFTPGTDWEYNSVDGTITIKTASDTETYVFWSQPLPIAQK